MQQIYKTYVKLCKKYAQYATNMQNICKIEGWRSLVGNVTELDAVGCQFEAHITPLPLVSSSGYSFCMTFAKSMQNICKIYARYMQDTCKTYARNMQKMCTTCRKCAENTKNMQKYEKCAVYANHASNMQNMHKGLLLKNTTKFAENAENM